jgi:hypothetical protein
MPYSLADCLQALIIANERGRYSAVGKSATAALFLGTPHRGSDVTFWSKTIDLIANFKFFDVNRTDFLKNLKPKSIELGDICSMFVERAVALQIFTIYERVKMKELPDLVSITISRVFFRNLILLGC